MHGACQNRTLGRRGIGWCAILAERGQESDSSKGSTTSTKATAELHLHHNTIVLSYNSVRWRQRVDLRDALIDWDEPDDQGSNTSHVGEHGLTPQEVE
jgi:hypothetical protein